jgi:hypothetical protein
MANRRVRLVRNVKLNGKPTFVTPVITPKGSVSNEMVLYKGQRLKVPADAGIWYIRWEEGHKPDNPSRLRLADAFQQYIDDQKPPLTVSPRRHF